MAIYGLLEDQTSMRAEWRSVLITSGGQCVMITGTTLMPLWSVSSWDMHTLEVSYIHHT